VRNLYYFCLVFSITTNLHAFGQTGHRITGAIADKHISNETRLALSEIIGNETLAEASTYADEMKSNPDEFWQKRANSYHYVTVPEGKIYQDVGSPKRGDAFEAIKNYSNLVRDPLASKQDKAMAIKFIVHLIGDLHQPLHVGNGTDRGGNDLKLKFFGNDSNLHRIWDSGMINRKQLSFTEWTNWLNRTISKQDITNWKQTDPLIWINESMQIRNTIYPTSASIKYRYMYDNIPVLKIRLKQAGIRIAAYLDELLKNQKLEK
jgi:nuclease S1